MIQVSEALIGHICKYITDEKIIAALSFLQHGRPPTLSYHSISHWAMDMCGFASLAFAAPTRLFAESCYGSVVSTNYSGTALAVVTIQLRNFSRNAFTSLISFISWSLIAHGCVLPVSLSGLHVGGRSIVSRVIASLIP